MTGYVIPGDGESAAQVARDLLSLADSPYDVQTSTDDGLMFVVPDRLAEAYSALHAEVRQEQSAPGPDETAATPKRRARARKES